MNKLTFILLFVPLMLNAQWRTGHQKEIDVWIQDQTTAPYHMYFMTEEKTDITLALSGTKNDTFIVVSSSHGITTDDWVIINYGAYTHQTAVEAVDADTVSIVSPLFSNLPLTTQVVKGEIDMAVNGSATPVTFYCRPYNTEPIDIQHLHVFIQDNLEGDDSKYGGIAALTNGTLIRQEDGVTFNLGVYKSNADFIQFGGVSSYTAKAGGGNYSMNFAYDLKETYGVVIRLDADGYLTATIYDDLTGLLSQVIVATGQVTLNE